MKRIIPTLCFCAFSIFIHAQCTFENMLPIELGITKFKATNSIASIQNIEENTETNRYSDIFNKWDKPDYLIGDSVFKTSIFYEYLNHDCFKGDKNELYLRFVDDKLYIIEIELTFSKDEFEKCIENYNSLITIFKNTFLDWSEFIKSKEATNEQIGEGYWFYPTFADKRDTVKIEKLSIGYEVKFESLWSDYKKAWYQTGNIDNYIIEIEYVNLKGTKLTIKGY